MARRSQRLAHCAAALSCLLAPWAGSAADAAVADMTLWRDIYQLAAAPKAHSESTEPQTGEPSRDVNLRASRSGSPIGVRGYVQSEVARTFGSPDHWSKMLVRSELSAQGRFNEQVKWKLSGRAQYDPVYDLYSFYPPEVRDDQRSEFTLRENYLDVAAGGWDLRLGRQQIVWGEIVGLFFADVVSAKDLREFLLPEFDTLRIPQWAARAEYSGEQFHAELLWIPVPSYDKIGKPGAEFFPPPPPVSPGVVTTFIGETKPARKLSHMNYGVRLSTLQAGWDVSAFYYRSMDTAATFYRQVAATPQPTAFFEARHDRISQLGATMAKDLGSFVAKAEAVYTRGRHFNVARLSEPDGVVPQNTLDWIASLDFNFAGGTRLNLQLFQRIFFDRDPDIFFRERENGASILLAKELNERTEAEILLISSLDRSDWMLRPRLTWKFRKDWRLQTGVDLFGGSPIGLFGRFANRDRAYGELRYSF